MIDIDYLKKIRLVSRPFGQYFVGNVLLFPNYHIFAKVEIEIENRERIPKGENVIFAMNHTDRFNYWPFQYKMLKLKEYPFTTVWVKAKYYKNAFLAKGLDLCNMIPVPSMGYFIEEFYRKKFHQRMDRSLYRIVKDRIDGRIAEAGPQERAAIEALQALGDHFAEFIRGHYDAAMGKVAELSRTALFEKNLNLIIFPEGTRSLTLAEGRTGLAQLALHTGKRIVPVACNNSEAVYTGSLPFARSGRITYRIGEPLSVNDRLKDFRIDEPFRLFSREAQERYREQFEGVTRTVMASIEEMLDERYRRGSALPA
ncbi:MAG: lysophospholipid acyltransferase family protein [Deltaproteobacteria bacterium]|nr:lysophospholipid acyltransferase family protein [Deltaproteobacteria bacterium]